MLNADFIVDGIVFEKNFNKEGGGIYVAGNFIEKDGTYANRKISNCKFKKNNSTKGGGLFLDGAAADLESNEFVENRATIRGGGLYAKLAKTIDTTTTTTTDTSGARLLATTLSTTLSKTKVKNNYGELGGGINYEG